MASSPRLCVVIPTFNERETLPDLVEQVDQLIPAATLLVVDDNSPDGTGQWVREQAHTNLRLQLLHREACQGLGSATLAGISSALQGPFDWVATMDADFSHDPRDLAKLWQRIAEPLSDKRATNKGENDCEIDVLIGSRYVEGGTIVGWSWKRRAASRLVNGISRWLLGLRTRDNSGALRIYRAELLRATDLSRVDSSGFAYLEQLLWLLQRSGARISEHPITFRDRRAGKSKANIRESLRAIADLTRLAVFRR